MSYKKSNLDCNVWKRKIFIYSVLVLLCKVRAEDALRSLAITGV